MLVDGLNLREAPGTNAPIETVPPGEPISGHPIRASAGDLVWVIGEDRSNADVWYHIVLDKLYWTGWVSGGPEDEPWLALFDRARCPSGLIEVLGEVDNRRSMEYPVCFGDRSLSGVVYWPTLEEGHQAAECPWPYLEPRWLICPEFVNTSGDGLARLYVYDTQGNDQIRRGEWVTIVGHFDDPRSEHCAEDLGRDMTDSAEVVATTLSCRAAFVFDDVGPP